MLHTYVFVMLLSGLVVVAPTRDARAAPTAAQQQRIDGLLTEAAGLIRAERYDEALDLVTRAEAIAKTAEVLNFRGRILYLLRRDDAAREAYEAALRAPDPIAPAVRKAIEDGLANLARRERGTLELDVSPRAATLEIDGVAATRDVTGRVDLPRGTHRIVLRHDGYEPHAQDVDVPGGDTLRVVIALAREREVVVREVEVAHDSGVDFGAWPWVSLGLGVAAAGVGTWLVIDGTADWDAVDSDMPKAQAEALVDSGSDKRTGGFVALGVGGALVATAVVLFLLESDGAAPASTGAAVGLVPLGDGIGAFVGGAF